MHPCYNEGQEPQRAHHKYSRHTLKYWAMFRQWDIQHITHTYAQSLRFWSNQWAGYLPPSCQRLSTREHFLTPPPAPPSTKNRQLNREEKRSGWAYNLQPDWCWSVPAAGNLLLSQSTYVQQELRKGVSRKQAIKLNHPISLENIHAALLFQACV